MQSTVQQLANRLRVIDGDAVYVPTSGLFWLRKGTKQCVSLKTDQDFISAINEYTSKNGQISPINIACLTVDRPNTSGTIKKSFTIFFYIFKGFWAQLQKLHSI